MSFKITKNTDSIDVQQKCIGMNITRTTWPIDVRDHLRTNRGLHLQIRHNGDKQTFGQANEVANLISAAPDMLEALELLNGEVMLALLHLPKDSKVFESSTIEKVAKALTKAKGGET